jgi:hypothetical protein
MRKGYAQPLVITLVVALASMIFGPFWFDVVAQGNPPEGCPPVYPAQCHNPEVKSDGAKTSWPSGAQVKVNIDPSFNSQKRTAIVQAFQNWQNGSGSSGNELGVTFTFTYNNQAPPSPPAPGIYSAQVWNANPPGANAGKAGYIEVQNNGTNAVDAEIWSNTETTDPCALAQTAAHEIGHSFGLDECPDCGFASSVMVEGDNGYNSENGTYGPTACDNAAVKKIQSEQACNDAGGYLDSAGECKTMLTPDSSTQYGGGWDPNYSCTNYYWVEDWYFWSDTTQRYEYGYSEVISWAGCWAN